MPSRREGYFVGAYMTNYVNDLVEDMGLPITRTGNFLAEYLAPCFASRYATLTAERRERRVTGDVPKSRFYFSAMHAAIALVLIGVIAMW
jgi:hypothetical protein